MNKEELMAMGYAFLSYLFRDRFVKNKVNRVFLFGSVARNDFDKGSDVDIFIDVEERNEKQLGKVAQRALQRFSRIEGEKWRLKGINNKISLKVGDLKKWKLKSSVEREGLVLFSPTFTSNLIKYLLFYLKPITSPKKRMKITRALFGRQEKDFKSLGLVQKEKGKVLNPRTFIVPSSSLHRVSSFLSKEKVHFAFEEIWQ